MCQCCFVCASVSLLSFKPSVLCFFKQTLCFGQASRGAMFCYETLDILGFLLWRAVRHLLETTGITGFGVKLVHSHDFSLAIPQILLAFVKQQVFSNCRKAARKEHSWACVWQSWQAFIQTGWCTCVGRMDLDDLGNSYGNPGWEGVERGAGVKRNRQLM